MTRILFCIDDTAPWGYIRANETSSSGLIYSLSGTDDKREGLLSKIAVRSGSGDFQLSHYPACEASEQNM